MLNGGAGDDTLDASSYTDAAITVDLSSEFTTFENVIGTMSADDITGSVGANELAGGAGSDTLQGGNGRDTLVGGNGDDSLVGGMHGDMLDGGAGRDMLDGGAGRDTLTGGSGRDTFIWGNDDTITDYQVQGDVDIDLGLTISNADGTERPHHYVELSQTEDGDLMAKLSANAPQNAGEWMIFEGIALPDTQLSRNLLIDDMFDL